MDVAQYKALLTEDQQDEVKTWLLNEGIDINDVRYAEFDRKRGVITVAYYLRDAAGKHFVASWANGVLPTRSPEVAMSVRDFIPTCPPPHWKGR